MDGGGAGAGAKWQDIDLSDGNAQNPNEWQFRKDQKGQKRPKGDGSNQGGGGGIFSFFSCCMSKKAKDNAQLEKRKPGGKPIRRPPQQQRQEVNLDSDSDIADAQQQQRDKNMRQSQISSNSGGQGRGAQQNRRMDDQQNL